MTNVLIEAAATGITTFVFAFLGGAAATSLFMIAMAARRIADALEEQNRRQP